MTCLPPLNGAEPGMPSRAKGAFDKNAEDVLRLLEIHGHLGGSGVGRRTRLEVLNKSAIVLITAIWEAYCEDIAAEALEALVARVPDASALPKELKKRIAKEMKTDTKDELAVWRLADDGWKSVTRARLAALTEERNRKLNTPKSDSIDRLFSESIGLERVSDRWAWTRMTAKAARAKLDKFVSMRGAIAHRGRGSTTCRKAEVDDYFRHVRRLVRKTGGRVNGFVKKTTGTGLW